MPRSVVPGGWPPLNVHPTSRHAAVLAADTLKRLLAEISKTFRRFTPAPLRGGHLRPFSSQAQ
jgi:hypothetical protein